MRACVRLIRSGERAPAQGKKRKSSACAQTDCNTASLWMLALMERNLVAAYIESPQQSRAPRLLAIAEANGKRRSRPLGTRRGIRGTRDARAALVTRY